MIVRFFLSYDICLSIHLMLHLHAYSMYASSKGSGEYANSSDQPEPWLLANVIRPNKKNKCVSGNGSENFRLGRQTYFFSGKNIILCILKGEFTFQNAKYIFFPRKLEKF